MEKKNKMGEVEEKREPNPRGEREWDPELRDPGTAGATSPPLWGVGEGGGALQVQVTGRKGGRMWDKPTLDGLYVLYWPRHLGMDPGICVLEWPLSGLKQEADRVADRKRAKL